MDQTLPQFIERWKDCAGAERANKDSFFKELCTLLGVSQPDPVRGDPKVDRYVFERGVKTQGPDGKITTKFIDLYKEGCFVLEAKQSGEQGALKSWMEGGKNQAWENRMEKARTQAYRYADNLPHPPPFLIVCDIGLCFDIYACFDGTTRYTPFPIPQKKRIPFKDIGSHLDLLRTIWSDPFALDLSKKAKKVTEEVAASLAELARELEKTHPPEAVAEFLMRCLFTMFAEDVGLLEEDMFTNAIEKYWLPSPASFPAAIEGLWRAMNDGSPFGLGKSLLRFNGHLFKDPAALKLTQRQLEMLLAAAKRDWSNVEPAIFGTLLEQALNAKERHRLGAHYTPRAYVERLVRPTVEEPLRAEWDIVKAEVWGYRQEKRNDEAKTSLKQFHTHLLNIRVLDPACGTGNFLYVTLDILKQIEAEIFAALRELKDKQEILVRVGPQQLLGIEVNPRARAIAELVLWLGHLQWHYRAHGRLQPPPEPVLQNLHNIECRDAVLSWDKIELMRDAKGKPISRWDGETMKRSPVTGDMIPDETLRVPVERYINPKKAPWPKADFVVGNPPFLGNWRMRSVFGEGYTTALRGAYDKVPESVDFVMYWWQKAAEQAGAGKLRRFGLITTNSICQRLGRQLIEPHLAGNDRISIVFAIPDHPWVDTADGAAVRIAMTVAEPGEKDGILSRVTSETGSTEKNYVEVDLTTSRGRIHSDLTIGAAVASAISLRANASLSSPGMKLHGAGFMVTLDEATQLGWQPGSTLARYIRPYVNGRDLSQRSRKLLIVDLYGADIVQVRNDFPAVYQWIYDRLHQQRTAKVAGGTKDSAEYAGKWWLFGKPRPELRKALLGLSRYIVTVETAKHRFFIFLDATILPDNKLICIASSDALLLGLLSSKAHVCWALASGGHLGVGNDPVYVKSACFDKFPFPEGSAHNQRHIRKLGESLDAHRKRRQAAHPDLTITGMYNILEKLRSGAELTEKEKVIHQQGLVSVLKQIHDDLDAAVFDAYGWPHDLPSEQILEKLVALNAERAEEERKGTIRWLRPDFQNPSGQKAVTQPTLTGTEDEEEKEAASPGAQAWPKKRGERIAAIRDLVLGSKRLWTTSEITRAFKGAKRKDVADFLESLDGLGTITAYGETEKDRRWGDAAKSVR